MKNYKNSSYAANKYSKDIVYNSEVSGSTSITLDDFLKSDPTLTKADFEFWKNWSDEDYRVESKETNNQTKKMCHLRVLMRWLLVLDYLLKNSTRKMSARESI